LGNAAALGSWNESVVVVMDRWEGKFTAEVDLSGEHFPVEYKYGIYDLAKKTFVKYEDGANRILNDQTPANGSVIINDGFARLSFSSWRGAGVAIPVFSLRSKTSFGIGEFLDLPQLADWAAQAGLKLIQILPVNDTIATNTWRDSYPYAGISAFALHPVYLKLDRLGDLGELKTRREELNAQPEVDYEAVISAKMAFIRKVFPAQRKKIFDSKEYQEFFASNKHWLEPYAAFCFFRDKYKTADFHQWPEHRNYDKKNIGVLATGDVFVADEMALHYFIQFHLHCQLREAAEYIHQRGLILKGDIAIGVYRHSADVWQNPNLFHTDMQAGAPPDAFAAKGQNWGFPTYNWPRMKQDGYDWWKRRFEQMGNYFDAFRIDHILGFFRIWSIPRSAVEGILGYFVPALPVRDEEFRGRGIPFNRERFARPFINGPVLHEIFGDNDARIKNEFLDGPVGGEYALKSKFATQRDVEKQKVDPALKEGLFDLISNLILIETPTGELHFRLGMENTPSFRQLDGLTQARLKDLCINYFYKRQDDFWMREAMQKLPALKRVTNMLICGEDLGMVPACVPVVMKSLGLLGLEIQRMPKALNVHFSRPADAPYLSVVTPSTHDMSTIRGWWLEDRNNTQLFFNEELHQSGAAPQECDAWVVREVVRQHLDSPAIWSIFQLQDLMGMDDRIRRKEIEAERINVPAIVNYYWRYRMHKTLEDLTRAKPFSQLVNDMVKTGGR
jgi:4-alpha-glucanotransferase